MAQIGFPSIEKSIARCRLILSVSGLIAVFVDPTEAILTPWVDQTGWFAISRYTLIVFGLHLLYSLTLYGLLSSRLPARKRIIDLTTWADVAFGAAIAFFTEGASSPFHVFFVFAVVEVGLRAGFRRTLVVTAASVALYLSLIVVSEPGAENFYIMRPVYLAIVGYLVAYLGQQRLNLEAEIRALAEADQRNRIARDLHDGWAQALAGINVQIETSRQLLLRGQAEQAAEHLSRLRISVNREYDDLRAYMRSLAGVNERRPVASPTNNTQFVVKAELKGSGPFVDHVLQIVREAVSNTLRHARARSASVHVRTAQDHITISVDDDGVGFQRADERPWSIASRVRELGGRLDVFPRERGAHFLITLPQS
jgi:signal transduction histidine kinase